MKNRKRIIPVIMVIAAVLLAILLLMIKQKNEKTVFSRDFILADELPSLLSFAYYDAGEWEQIVGRIAKGKISYKELENLLREMGVQEYIDYEPLAGYKPVPREDFFQIYRQIVSLLDTESSVASEALVFIGEKDKEGQWITHRGIFSVNGGEQYIHPYDMYQVFTINGVIAGIEKCLTDTVHWENVFVHNAGDGHAELLFEKEHLTIEIPTLTDSITETICDLEWTDGAVSAIYKKEDTIRGTVLSYNEEQIEIAGYGVLKHSGPLKIYKTYGTVEQLDESKLMVGNLVADFVVARGNVCGIILREPAEPENIRVLLLNGETPYHPEALWMADEETTVTFGETRRMISANTLIKSSDFWQAGEDAYIRIETATENGCLYLVNEKQEHISLGYHGAMEVRKFPEGFGIVNELSLEDYLGAVVPSEMPASYEMEALRAQAVCARSYACMQLARGEYAGFGANVDDSTGYQVYNKQQRDARAELAVKDTVGEVIKYNDAIAEAYYYSTSCGFSQNSDIWNLADEEKYGYLRSISLLTDGSYPDFSDEAVFTAYIKDTAQTAYDSDMPYFRWRAGVDLKTGLDAVNKAVEERQAANSANVKVLDIGGSLTDTAPSQLGTITGIVPEERSAGGVLKKLRIQYERGTVWLMTEYNIRKVLGAAVTFMTDKNGKDIDSMTLLPSAAFTVEQTEDGVVLCGGGYGHGIGLSQNGANGMAKAGCTYVDILQKFYQNIRIENIYNSRSGL